MDDFAYQAGLKAALAEQMGGVSPWAYKGYNYLKTLGNIAKGIPNTLQDIKGAAAKEAIRGYKQAPKDRSSYPYRYESEDINFMDFPLDSRLDDYNYAGMGQLSSHPGQAGLYEPSIENQNTLLQNTLAPVPGVPNLPLREGLDGEDSVLRSTAVRAALKAFGDPQGQRSLYQDPISFIQNQADIQGAVDYLNRTQNEEARSYIAPISMADTGRITDTGVISPTDPIELETTPVINALNMMVDKGITNVMPGTAPVEFTPTINPRLVDAAHLVPDITPQAFDDFVTSSVLGVDIPKTTKKKVDRDPKDAGQRPVVKALQQEQKKATQKVEKIEKQQVLAREAIEKEKATGSVTAEAAGKFAEKTLANNLKAAQAAEQGVQAQNTMATLLQAMNIQRSEEARLEQLNQQMLERMRRQEEARKFREREMQGQYGFF